MMPRQRDVEDFLQPIGSVHIRRLVQRRIDARQRSQIYDRVPAKALPDAEPMYSGRNHSDSPMKLIDCLRRPESGC